MGLLLELEKSSDAPSAHSSGRWRVIRVSDETSIDQPILETGVSF
jgi:hypothetical protein